MIASVAARICPSSSSVRGRPGPRRVSDSSLTAAGAAAPASSSRDAGAAAVAANVTRAPSPEAARRSRR
ncbi:hypothetical protein ACFPRL_10065 [Pseudoclavibacter helvolus]